MNTTSRELAAPLRVDSTGAFATITSLADIAAQHVRSVAGTQLGERVMRGDYGTDLLSHLFEGTDEAHSALLERDISAALARQCPEVTVVGVDITTDTDESTLSVLIRYRLANDVEASVTLNTTVGAL